MLFLTRSDHFFARDKVVGKKTFISGLFVPKERENRTGNGPYLVVSINQQVSCRGNSAGATKSRSGIPVMRYAVLVLLFLLPAGCSRTPQPVGYPATEQRKMQAVHHWDVLAQDVANEINNELIRHGYLETPVYVRSPSDSDGAGEASPFAASFRDLLVTRLVQFGVPTLNGPSADGLEIRYSVQVISYRDSPGLQEKIWPGMLTLLGSGITVLRHVSTDYLPLLGSMMADVVASTYEDTGRYEVVISTAIVSGNRYLVHRSDIYYIDDPDFWQYQPPPPVAEIELISDRR